MRLVKLSINEFSTERELQAFFAQKLPARIPPSLFPCGRQIGEKGLQPDETVLFTYKCRLRFVAKTKTGRMKNTYVRMDYPNCFVIDMKSLRQADVPLEEVEREFRTQLGFKKSLRTQSWTRIPDSTQAEQIIDRLVSS